MCGMRWKGLVAGLAAVSLLGGAAGPAVAAGTRVKMMDTDTENFFKPRRKVVEKGTRVKWLNAGSKPHTTTSNTGLWSSPTLQPGGTFARRFRQVGTFKYHCEIHDGMTGKIVVVA